VCSAGATAQASDDRWMLTIRRGPRARSGAYTKTGAIGVTIDPEDEEAPGVATPGGPRDIPVGMDDFSMRRMIRTVKQ